VLAATVQPRRLGVAVIAIGDDTTGLALACYERTPESRRSRAGEVA
jgi:predicted amidohydrolase YtcJ